MNLRPGPDTAADIRQQNQKIFQIYHFYRLALAIVLLTSYYYRQSISPLGSVDAPLFLRLGIGYALVNTLILLLSYRLTITTRHKQMLSSAGIIITDILLLTLLAYCSGGVSSGIAHLMIVPVATGSILFGARLGTFFAAIGSIAIIYSEVYLSFTRTEPQTFYVQAGLLGMMLFVSSIFLQYLGQRLRQKEVINLQQAASIQSLQQMNQQIIQRMQTGIVVVDHTGNILNCNNSARKMLTTAAAESAPEKLPAILNEQLLEWLDNPARRKIPLQIYPGAPDLLANFAHLQDGATDNILIFLEDYSQLSSRAQHLKLMSLGRLSASIAHEIRNPLGAISHACQLLGESASIEGEDQRLLTIINTHSLRVNTIIESILEHSRPRQQVPELLEVSTWLNLFLLRFSNSYSEPVEHVLSIDEEHINIQFNPGQLEQLLTNLCDNAIRYSRLATRQAYVKIHCYLNQQNHCPVIDIIDTGPGVPEDSTEHIFEPFFTTENSGTGLGLFICKEICEAHQARIYHTRSNDGESCFRIQFAHPERQLI